jgi:carbon-monoxide dehydrogenase medium subunit
MKLKKLSPQHLVNIKKVPGLDRISFDGKKLSIGALAKFNDIIFSPIIQEHFPVLADVSRMIASHQVRNLATIGGNLCNAAPSADSAPILIVLDAALKIHSAGGPRELPVENFFRGPGAVNLGPGEILTHIELKKPSSDTRAAYIKHEIRETLEIAITGVAVALTLASDGTCRDARVAVAACAPTPVRAREAENILRGTRLDNDTVGRAAEAAVRAISPIDDVRSCSEYRREMTAVSLRRAIDRATGRSGA